jgi:hypothetical protein
VTEAVIQRVQDRDQRTLEPNMLSDQRFGTLYVPRFMSWHGVIVAISRVPSIREFE